MYLFQSSMVVSKNMDSRLIDKDISGLSLLDIYTLYRKAFIVLTNPFLEAPVAVDMETLRGEFSLSQFTIVQMLTYIGDRTLTTMESIPVVNPKFAKFSDAFRAGYKIEPQNFFTSPTAELPASSKTSLRIKRENPSTDMNLFYNHCMVSINGYFHRTDADGTFAYALDATNSLFKSKQNQMGILSFLDIGKIEQIAITPDMISKQDDTIPLKDRAILRLDKDIENKTVLLVLGGYLVFPDDVSYWQNSDNTFVLDLNKLPMLERYYESLPYIDMSSLGLPVSSDNETLINVPEFFSDEVLTKYLSMSQSFFVIIDTPSIFTNKVYIRPSNLPGMFTSYKDPTLPLFVNNGRIAEYWKTFEDGYWAVNVQDSYLKNTIFSSKPQEQLEVISDSSIPERTFYNSRGFMLEIGTDNI